VRLPDPTPNLHYAIDNAKNTIGSSVSQPAKLGQNDGGGGG